MAKVSITTMEQLANALENANFTDADITVLRGYQKLEDFKSVLRGNAEILVRKHIIDMDVDPFIPQGLTLVSHEKQGQMEYGPNLVGLYLAEGQENGKRMNGKKLQKELESHPTYNANLLDWYEAHPALIPQEWRGKAVFFWKTIFRDAHGHLYVRFLYVSAGGSCNSHFRWIDRGFCDSHPAAVAGK